MKKPPGEGVCVCATYEWCVSDNIWQRRRNTRAMCEKRGAGNECRCSLLMLHRAWVFLLFCAFALSSNSVLCYAIVYLHSGQGSMIVYPFGGFMRNTRRPNIESVHFCQKQVPLPVKLPWKLATKTRPKTWCTYYKSLTWRYQYVRQL